MAVFSATVGGTEVVGVSSVDYGGTAEGAVGTAEITAQNTAVNREFEYGAEVRVFRDGEEDFRGTLTRKPPSSTRNLTVTLIARDQRAGLQDSQVNRPFYEMGSGEVVREIVLKDNRPQEAADAFLGEFPGDFSGDIPIIEAANLPTHDLQERGSGLIYLHWREGDSGSYSVSVPAVPSGVQDKNLIWFETRAIVNNRGDFFSGEVELRDQSGTSYVWDLDMPGTAEPFTTRLKAEEATSDGAELTTNGVVEYRFEIGGALPEARAIALDYARTQTFNTTSRDTPLSVSGVETTDREITRRFDTTRMEAIQTLAQEDEAISYVEGDTLHYESPGSEDSGVAIRFGETTVINVDVDRTSADIINKLTAQGAGDLQKEYRSTASIDFYGVREDTLIDTAIQSEEELDRRAEGVLSDNAWEDTAVAFTVAGSEFEAVRVGQLITVEWTPEGISGEFVVSSVDTDDVGRITIGVTGHEG